MSTLKTPNQLADELNISPKALRSIMRKLADEKPGSGGRWGIDSDFEALLTEYVNRATNRKVVVAKAKVTE